MTPLDTPTSPRRPLWLRLKLASLQWHKRLGLLLMLPILWISITGVSFTIAGEWVHNKALGKFLLHLHTFECIGLEHYFPLIAGLSIIALIVSGALLLLKPPALKKKQEAA